MPEWMQRVETPPVWQECERCLSTTPGEERLGGGKRGKNGERRGGKKGRSNCCRVGLFLPLWRHCGAIVILLLAILAVAYVV